MYCAREHVGVGGGGRVIDGGTVGIDVTPKHDFHHSPHLHSLRVFVSLLV